MNEISFTRSSTRVLTHVEPVNMSMKELEDILNSGKTSFWFDDAQDQWFIKDADGKIIGSFGETQMTADGDEDTEFRAYEA